MARMNRPAPVEVCYKTMRFLITHNPTNATLSAFIEDLKKYGATTVVRVCEVTYDKTLLEKDGITVIDWPFEDGAHPPTKIVDDWLSLLRSRFNEDPGCCVAVHCIAGLGRAPVLVALALIESGMKYEDAIQFIRQLRCAEESADYTEERPDPLVPLHPDNQNRSSLSLLEVLHGIQRRERPWFNGASKMVWDSLRVRLGNEEEPSTASS
ncbi:protein tyrosine phosphatase type IVA 3 isoform X1 [Pleurodeles waltl]|uniref:protein tyrosine phosphatase type IVA 3 isoform X1 n=1 Tax=Pleurodeles waltl TaxID=8319 RepID=UPI003709A98A